MQEHSPETVTPPAVPWSGVYHTVTPPRASAVLKPKRVSLTVSHDPMNWLCTCARHPAASPCGY